MCTKVKKLLLFIGMFAGLAVLTAATETAAQTAGEDIWSGSE